MTHSIGTILFTFYKNLTNVFNGEVTRVPLADKDKASADWLGINVIVDESCFDGTALKADIKAKILANVAKALPAEFSELSTKDLYIAKNRSYVSTSAGKPRLATVAGKAF